MSDKIDEVVEVIEEELDTSSKKKMNDNGSWKVQVARSGAFAILAFLLVGVLVQYVLKPKNEQDREDRTFYRETVKATIERLENNIVAEQETDKELVLTLQKMQTTTEAQRVATEKLVTKIDSFTTDVMSKDHPTQDRKLNEILQGQKEIRDKL